MEMIAVESSNVAAIGYASEYCLMRVQFHDGSLYDYPGISQSTHALVMNHPSKGRALGRLQGTKIEPQTETIKLREPAEPGIIETIEPDQCCSSKFAKAAREGILAKAYSWTCPGCGCEYRATAAVGNVRHWVAHIIVELL